MIAVNPTQSPAAWRTGAVVHAGRAAEIAVRSQLVVGVLEHAIAALERVGIRVLGTRGCNFGETEMALLVVTDERGAWEALKTAGLECLKINSVVTIQTEDPAAKSELIARVVGAGIRILYSYWLSSFGGHDYLVLKTVDDTHTLRVITGSEAVEAA